MTTGRLPSHHCHIARGLLTLILSIGHELLVFASFFVNIFKTIYQKKKTTAKLRDLKIVPCRIYTESFRCDGLTSEARATNRRTRKR